MVLHGPRTVELLLSQCSPEDKSVDNSSRDGQLVITSLKNHQWRLLSSASGPVFTSCRCYGGSRSGRQPPLSEVVGKGHVNGVTGSPPRGKVGKFDRRTETCCSPDRWMSADGRPLNGGVGGGA